MTIDKLQTEIQASVADLRAEIRLQGEITRRHFDLVAEEFRERTKALRKTLRLDDHEQQITTNERPGR
jgi:hypothetical protein